MRRPRSKPTKISNLSRGVELENWGGGSFNLFKIMHRKVDTVKHWGCMFKHGCRTCNSCINSYWSAAKLLVRPSSSNNPPCAGVCDILRAFSRRVGSRSKWRVKEITIPDIIYNILYLNFRLLRVTTSSGSLSQLWNLQIFRALTKQLCWWAKTWASRAFYILKKISVFDLSVQLVLEETRCSCLGVPTLSDQ